MFELGDPVCTIVAPDAKSGPAAKNVRLGEKVSLYYGRIGTYQGFAHCAFKLSTASLISRKNTSRILQTNILHVFFYLFSFSKVL